YTFAPLPPPDIYTLSLHDALPIFQYFGDGLQLRSQFVIQLLLPLSYGSYWHIQLPSFIKQGDDLRRWLACPGVKQIFIKCAVPLDRKSTRLNSSHVKISYAVFCLK